MADWNYVECGFNAANETINFGTRLIAGLDNLYETCTLASLKNSEKDTSPNDELEINGLIQNSSIYFSINKTMRSFTDLLCTDLNLNVTFGSEIDTFCLSGDGEHLLVCLRNGSIRCFNIKSKTVTYTTNVIKKEDTRERFFLKAFAENDCDTLSFIVVLACGKILRVEATEEVIGKDVKQEASEFTLHNLVDINASVQIAMFNKPNLFLAGERIYLLDVEKNDLTVGDTYSLKNAFFCSPRMIQGLTPEGKLINFCTDTLIAYNSTTETEFEDILLLTDDLGVYILGICKKNELGEFSLQLLSYPDFDVIFSLKMSETIHLITPVHNYDEIIYISQLIKDSQVRELRFQSVSETDPENRLKRLLRRQRFQEAEEFAKLFNLDLTDIQMAKAQMIVEKSICNKSDVDKLLEILKDLKYENRDFQIKCCLDTHCSCCDLEDVDRILNYGCSLSKDGYKEDLLFNQISNVMHRFRTFLALTKCGRKSNVLQWSDFLHTNLISEAISCLQQNEIDAALIIYNRLDAQEISEIQQIDVEHILSALTNISTNKKLSFLHMFLPLTLSYYPLYLDLFIKWTTEEIYYYELKQPNDFPENAIEFISKMKNLLKLDYSDVLSVQYVCATDSNSVAQISGTINFLIKLQTFKNNCGFVIPYKEFVKGKITLIETLLNVSMVNSIKINYCLEEFIGLFIFDTHINSNKIYANIIQELIVYSQEHWINIVPDILSLIKSTDEKLEISLAILKCSTIPWSATIHNIAKSAQQYTHPLVKNIIVEVEHESKCSILRKDPYNLKKYYINSIPYLEFVINRIIFCNEPTMVEDIYCICTNYVEKQKAHILLLNHFIQTENFEGFYNIIKNRLMENEIIECCKELIEAAIHIYEKENNDVQKNFMEVLSFMFRKIQNDVSTFEKNILQEKLENLSGCYNLRKEFNVFYSLSHIQNRKETIVQQILQQCHIDYQEHTNISSSYANACRKIAKFVNIELDVIFTQLFNLIEDFNVILKIIESFCENYFDAKLVCYIVTLIVRNIGSANTGFHIDDSLSSNTQDFTNVDVKTSIDALKLSQTLICRAILKCCDGQELRNCIELANWIQASYYLIRENQNSCLDSTQVIVCCPPTMSVLNAVKDSFQFYIDFICSLNLSNADFYIKNVQQLDEEILTQKKQLLQQTLCFLYSEGHGLTAYKLIQTLKFSLLNKTKLTDNIHNYVNQIIQQSTKMLIQNFMFMQNFDLDFVYSLVISNSKSESKIILHDALKLYKRDLVKFELITKLLLRYSLNYKIEEGKNKLLDIILLCKWWNKIENCQVPYVSFFKKSHEQVLESLISLNHMNISSIQNFCEDFNLNNKVYYELYLKNLLMNWKPSYNISKSLQHVKLLMKNEEHELLSKCEEVIDLINNGEAVFKVMKEVWNSINFYHYEVFLCIYNITLTLKGKVDNTQVMLLKFLKNYSRVGHPSSAEVEEWYTLYPDSRCIDDLSNWRLPYTNTLNTNKIWNIIRSEINIKTYPIWFNAIMYLKNLTKDDICSYVVKDIAASGIFESNKQDEWILHPKHVDLLNKIDKCVQNISNLERATSAVYLLANAIPGGADRVEAIKLCYKYALKYLNNNPNLQDVQDAFNKVEKKYFGDSTAHILHKNQLADKKYLGMVSKRIDELILELYMDDRILKKSKYITYQCPDINQAVDELAILHDVDILEKRKALLITWLSDSVNLDSSIFIIPKIDEKNKLDSAFNLANLIRASYVCTGGDISYWRKWLLEFGDVQLNESRNLKHKANALICFCNISDPSIIYKLTDLYYNEFINYINKLILISNLESFGFCLNIESLDRNDKVDLLNHLRYHKSNQSAIRNMALLCITYKENEHKYWFLIINEMLKLQMFQELRECLLYLSKNFVECISKKFIIDAWQSVINNQFSKTANSTENNITGLLVEIFHLIEACPVLYLVDLNYAVAKCIALKKYNFAALLVEFLPKDQQTLLMKKIWEFDRNICKNVEELAQFGFYSVSVTCALFLDFHKENGS